MANIIKIISNIQKKSETAEDYNTGLIGEHIIVASYDTMAIDKLEKLRFIINKIIKKKKELKRSQNVYKNI